MAEVVSLEQAKVNAGTKLANDEALGRIQTISISTPLAAAATTWAQNDTIASPVDIPKGSRPVGYRVFHEAMGTSVTLDIGLRKSATVDSAQTVVDADGIATGLDVAAAGFKSSSDSQGALFGVSATQAIYKTQDVYNVYCTLADATPDAGQVLRVDVDFALPG